MDISFRNADLNDLPLIVGTYNATVPGRMVTADLEPVTVESKLDWLNAHNPQTRPLWMLYADKEYAGWVSYQSFYGRPAYNKTAELSIYLEANMQGRGLGKICLQKAIDECPKLNIHTLLGFIFGHNEPSLKLFYAFGFEKWAHLPKVAEMDGIERDLIIVGKRIG